MVGKVGNVQLKKKKKNLPGQEMTRRKDLNLISQVIDQSTNRSSPSPYHEGRKEGKGRKKEKKKKNQ